MPWKLVEPRKDKTPYWYIRGTYLGIALDKSTGTADRAAAKRILKTWREKAERGEFGRGQEAPAATFLGAAVAYMSSGGSPRFVGAILKKWRERSLDSIDQIAIDTLAAELYPAGTASTRNRQVYTPVLAILERAGIQAKIKRPKGWTGTRRTFWLRPEPTFALLDAAATQDAEFGIFCTLLNYCGLRLGEAFALDCDEIDLSREFAYLPTTKTDEPRAVYLPPHVVAELASHPGGLDRKGRLFSFRSYRTLYRLLDAACKASGIELPRRVGFHVFRHNYGTWMRIYAGLDSLGLTRLGVWEDMDSVERYSHSEPTAEARQAAKLPTPKRGQVVEIKKVSGE